MASESSAPNSSYRIVTSSASPNPTTATPAATPAPPGSPPSPNTQGTPSPRSNGAPLLDRSSSPSPSSSSRPRKSRSSSAKSKSKAIARGKPVPRVTSSPAALTSPPSVENAPAATSPVPVTSSVVSNTGNVVSPRALPAPSSPTAEYAVTVERRGSASLAQDPSSPPSMKPPARRRTRSVSDAVRAASPVFETIHENGAVAAPKARNPVHDRVKRSQSNPTSPTLSQRSLQKQNASAFTPPTVQLKSVESSPIGPPQPVVEAPAEVPVPHLPITDVTIGSLPAAQPELAATSEYSAAYERRRSSVDLHEAIEEMQLRDRFEALDEALCAGDLATFRQDVTELTPLTLRLFQDWRYDRIIDFLIQAEAEEEDADASGDSWQSASSVLRGHHRRLKYAKERIEVEMAYDIIIQRVLGLRSVADIEPRDFEAEQREDRNSVFYKLVAVVGNRYFSVYDGKTEYRVGSTVRVKRKKKQKQRQPHNGALITRDRRGELVASPTPPVAFPGRVKGGYFAARTIDSCLSARFPPNSALLYAPRVLLKVRVSGRVHRLKHDIVRAEKLKPIEVVCRIIPTGHS